MNETNEMGIKFITETINKSVTMHNCTSTVVLKKPTDEHGLSDSLVEVICNVIEASNKKEVIVVVSQESDEFISLNMNFTKINAKLLSDDHVVYVNTKAKAICSTDYNEDSVRAIIEGFTVVNQDTSLMNEEEKKEYTRKMIEVSHEKEIKIIKVYNCYCKVFDYGIDINSNNFRKVNF